MAQRGEALEVRSGAGSVKRPRVISRETQSVSEQEESFVGSIIEILVLVANVIVFLVLIQLVIGLLVQFDVLRRPHPIVFQIYNGINTLLDPLLSPIRKILPPAGGLDFSPLVLLLSIQVLIIVLRNNAGAFG